VAEVLAKLLQIFGTVGGGKVAVKAKHDHILKSVVA
jgi:hypothetical protein